eukprot:scaffold191706_cov30-Tisochrysis_lutea.AAC.4
MNMHPFESPARTPSARHETAKKTDEAGPGQDFGIFFRNLGNYFLFLVIISFKISQNIGTLGGGEENTEGG